MHSFVATRRRAARWPCRCCSPAAPMPRRRSTSTPPTPPPSIASWSTSARPRPRPSSPIARPTGLTRAWSNWRGQGHRPEDGREEPRPHRVGGAPQRRTRAGASRPPPRPPRPECAIATHRWTSRRRCAVGRDVVRGLGGNGLRPAPPSSSLAFSGRPGCTHEATAALLGDPRQRIPARALAQRRGLDARDPRRARATARWALAVVDRRDRTGRAVLALRRHRARDLCCSAATACACVSTTANVHALRTAARASCASPANAGVHGELIDGATQDFNLMWRRDAIEAQLWHRPLVGPMVIFAEPGTTWAVHLLAGQARFARRLRLAVRWRPATPRCCRRAMTRLRHVLDGGGEVLLAQLQAALRCERVRTTRAPARPAYATTDTPITLTTSSFALRPRAHIQMPDRPSSNMRDGEAVGEDASSRCRRRRPCAGG